MTMSIDAARSVRTSDRLDSKTTYDEAVKRLLDIIVAICAIVILGPVLLSVFFIMARVNPHGAIYRHRRVGRNGEPFRCYKFQTMLPDADAILAAHLAAEPAAAQEWIETRKLRKDPRVTRLGAFLRATSLDELPQLFNILFGQMSFVGPRPITFPELDRYGGQAHRYLTVRPGLTGLWQISGRSALNYSERVDLDMVYLNNRSIGLDLVIMLKTIPAVARTRQAA